jgi:hypothetical protein
MRACCAAARRKHVPRLPRVCSVLVFCLYYVLYSNYNTAWRLPSYLDVSYIYRIAPPAAAQRALTPLICTELH